MYNVHMYRSLLQNWFVYSMYGLRTVPMLGQDRPSDLTDEMKNEKWNEFAIEDFKPVGQA